MRNTARANIINALHALENGKPAAEVTAWLKDAIVDLAPPVERTERKLVIDGYTIEQNGNVMSVRDVRGDEVARCVQYPDFIVVHLRDRMYPVEVKTMEAAIDYINMVAALK